MENESIASISENPEKPSLVIDGIGVSYLIETAKWGRFLAIMGFIALGMLVIASFFMGTLFSLMPRQQGVPMPHGAGFFITFTYLIIAVLYFFPTWYLYKYSKQLKLALQQGDRDTLNEAFKNQKSLYRFFGILSIIVLVLYALGFIMGAVGALLV